MADSAMERHGFTYVVKGGEEWNGNNILVYDSKK